MDTADPDDGPLRRCIATGEKLDPERMIRFVADPEGRLVPDITGKLPGRGIWVGATRAAIDRAVAKRLFPRAAKCAVAVDADLPATVERLVARQCLDLLGMARRASLIAAGFDQVETMLRKGKAGVWIEATDGSADGRDKLGGLAGNVRMVSLFPASALATAIGRDGIVVHAAIAAGKLAERFVAASDRLAGLRGLA
jgi:predicted RNA-binding protein YlxR (DUF448 family)